MRYNLFISDANGNFNIFNINEDQLNKAINAYLDGASSLTLTGEKFVFNKINTFKIFTFETDKSPEEAIKYYKNNVNFRIKNMFGIYLPVRTLALMGKDVTDDFIGDSAYGERSLRTSQTIELTNNQFISTSRIQELRNINSQQFDLVRLIKLCDEVNSNYKFKNFMSVVIICRAILDHVPPIFGFDSFDKVVNNYGGPKMNKSFKGNMSHLNISLRNIADKYLHQVIRTTESLPNETQINFSQDLDVLLEEIVRILKKKLPS
jgi:hypothetical protein